MTTRTTDGLVPRDGVPSPSGSPLSSSQPAHAVRRALRRVVRIQNPLGLHQRAADRFAREAKRYLSSVTIWNGDLKADGRDLWALLALIVMPDSEVILEVEGADAEEALDGLASVLGAPAGEDYTI